MRTSLPTGVAALAAALLLLASFAPHAVAAETDALAKVKALETKVVDPTTSWESRFHAYLEAKQALGEAEGPDKADAEAAYAVIQPQVAEALRRTTLPLGGWLMGFFAATLLWGGFAITLTIAMRAEKARKTYGPDAT